MIHLLIRSKIFNMEWEKRYSFQIVLVFICLQVLFTEVHSTLVRILQVNENERRPYVNTKTIQGSEKEDVSGSETNEAPFRPLPFPVNYSFYDVNGDANVDIKELILVTGPAENVQKAFSASDLNGDGYVTEEEYQRKPWGYNPDDVIVN